MQKYILAAESFAGGEPGRWLDLTQGVHVELTSEDPGHPIEGALYDLPGDGWKAAASGPQTLVLCFDAPQRIREVLLRFEAKEDRTQEFTLAWSSDDENSYREIVRQPFNFSGDGASVEEEVYIVHLSNVTRLKLHVVPDISRGPAHATLRYWRISA